MALPPSKDQKPGSKPEDDVIIREIDEAVRQDDAAQFFKKYGAIIAGVIIAGLLGLGGYLFWKSRTESNLEAQSEQLVSVLDYAQAQDYRSVDERIDPLLDNEVAGIRTSARFLEAGAALDRGETDKAVEFYAAIANDEEAPKALRDLARIREVASNYDAREPADVIARLEDLAVPGNPFFASAAELVAMAQLEAGDEQAAGTLFAAIAKDDEQPESLRSRARQMAGLLGIDAVEDVDELLEDEGIGPQNAPQGIAGPPSPAGPAR